MKQTVITMLLMLVTMTAAAQEKDHKRLAENFFNAKVAELALRLDMTEEQKEKFVPIYRHYNDEMKATMGPRKLGHHTPKDKKDFKKGKPQLSDEEQLTLTKQHLERQQQAQAIRLKYVDEFATVLNAQQIKEFFDVEKDIAKMMAKRRTNHKGPHHCLTGKGPRPEDRPEKPQN